MSTTTARKARNNLAQRKGAAIAHQRRRPATLAEAEAQVRSFKRTPPPPHPGGTDRLYRMIGTGATGHKGAEVAKLFATGAIRATLRNTDAAGPLKEDVGLTTQRGGALDYRGQGAPSHTEAKDAMSPSGRQMRAERIAQYEARRPNLPAKHAPQANGKAENAGGVLGTIH